MAHSNKKMEDFLDQKLRRSSVISPKEDFSRLLMEKVISEHKRLSEETRKERIVKYVLGSFSTFMIGFTIVMGYMYGRSQAVTSGSELTVERSNTLVGKLVTAIQSVFISVLNFFGVSVSTTTLNVTLIILLVIGIYLLGERLFLRGRYKSVKTHS